ncbi:hypothetical protein JNUCC64_01900 [Streptomyces sp. JNUCC 64]
MNSPGPLRLPAAPLRALTVLLAALALVLAVPAPAGATALYEVPAAREGGVALTVRLHSASVPRPYQPDPTASEGPRKCVLRYHEYYGTQGCGGFQVNVLLRGLRAQPGYPAAVRDGVQGRFAAYADVARTFGCADAGGVIDPATKTVVRETQRRLDEVYFSADVGYVVESHAKGSGDFGPQFYVNFAPVRVDCPSGTTATQYGLKVSNLTVHAPAPALFRDPVWTHPGPYYA